VTTTTTLTVGRRTTTTIMRTTGAMSVVLLVTPPMTLMPVTPAAIRRTMMAVTLMSMSMMRAMMPPPPLPSFALPAPFPATDLDGRAARARGGGTRAGPTDAGTCEDWMSPHWTQQVAVTISITVQGGWFGAREAQPPAQRAGGTHLSTTTRAARRRACQSPPCQYGYGLRLGFLISGEVVAPPSSTIAHAGVPRMGLPQCLAVEFSSDWTTTRTSPNGKLPSWNDDATNYCSQASALPSGKLGPVTRG
jgi:hypothetical protein